MSTTVGLRLVCVYCQHPTLRTKIRVLPVSDLPPRERPKVRLCDPCSMKLSSGHITASEFQWL